jgi:hypothetical protein
MWAKLIVLIEQQLVFEFSPGTTVKVGIELVKPSLATLLRGSPISEAAAKHRPVTGAEVGNVISDDFVLLRSEKAFREQRIQTFFPSSRNLRWSAVHHLKGNGLPFVPVLANQSGQPLVLFVRPPSAH